MIELEGLTKDFGSLRAVDGISLKIPRGEFFAVLGPNAAGKTTTIKMMVGLIRPTTGRARIAGFDIQENPLEARSRLSCDELVPRFNLEDWLDQPIESLSHGTRQRIAIASALLHHPEVFIIDEPMVGLDPHHARVVKDILRERATQGMTVFLSTHQVSVAEEMADRIGVFHRGRVIACGTAAELRSQSQTSGSLESAFLTLTREDETRVGPAAP